MHHLSRTWLLLLSAWAMTACVSKSTYDAAVEHGNDARSELNRELARREEAIQEREQRTAELQRQLDAATAENGQLRTELARLGTDVDSLLSERGVLASELAESRMRLDELRRAEAAAERRARLYRDLVLRLKRMVDAGSLQIVLREGRMVLRLPDDILFDSGRSEIKPRGRAALRDVAAVLKTLEGRHFHIGGHTDNVPIATTRFPSNWELSLSRGLAVLRVLVAEGVPAHTLAAEGFGEFDPIALNDDDQGRAQNRRTEIALQPEVDELVAVPDGERLAAQSE